MPWKDFYLTLAGIIGVVGGLAALFVGMGFSCDWVADNYGVGWGLTLAVVWIFAILSAMNGVIRLATRRDRVR